jgi:hypothetical protein
VFHALLVTLAAQGAAAAGATSPIRGVIDDMTTIWVEGNADACPIDPAVPLSPAGDPSGCWYGHVRGDITGQIALFEDPLGHASAHASSWHFTEKFTLRQGVNYISGFVRGLWSHTGKFHASGFVTATSGGWSELLGYRFFYAGVTTCYADGSCTAFGTQLGLAKASGEPLG